MNLSTAKENTGANSPTFLGTEAQHFRAFGTFGALGSPMGAQSQVAISLFVRRGFEGPDRNQAQGLAVVARTDCEGKMLKRKKEEICLCIL